MLLGLNVDPQHGFTPEEIRDTGSRVVRIPLWKDYRSWVKKVSAMGLEVMAVCDGNTMKTNKPEQWQARFEQLARMYPTIRYWQVGNEPDHESGSSWTMPQDVYNALLRAARLGLKGKYIVGAGLASGDPNWLDRVNLDLMQGCGVHPYGQEPDGTSWDNWGFGKVSVLLQRYRTKTGGKPIFISEFGGEDSLFNDATDRAKYHSDMIVTLSRLGVEAACVFCYSDRMVPGFGLIDGGSPKEAYAAFHDAANSMARNT